MITFLVAIAVLIIGYLIYGVIVEKIFGANPKRPTPAITKADGVDFVPMSGKKIFLVQFLNIAGLGPIFGAISGALWGPVAFLWIVFGCIFGGAVHDYISGMISLRSDGASLPEIVGKYQGKGMKNFMRFFAVILLVIVGAVFIKGPAVILHDLTGLNTVILAVIIFLYYLIATLAPVDKIIGKVYPIFGLVLLIMALGLFFALIFGKMHIPEISLSSFTNWHSSPEKFPTFPMLFVTIACGAISGFHATQSPMMARCMTNERQGRKIFYGAMITEGVLALIWAAVSMSFFGGVHELGTAMAKEGNNAAWVVNEICNTTLGKVGGALAIIGVVAAPITSGDTAFRSARLSIADALGFSQKPISKRLAISIPLFAAGLILTQVDFGIIWRYFGWANQTLAAITLWTLVLYMAKKSKPYIIVLIPAIFMTVVITSYILVAPEGFGLKHSLGYLISIIVSLIITLIYLSIIKRRSVVVSLNKAKIEPKPEKVKADN
ncbi:MAG: carbon starvation protein A [Hyphomicrobiales bacterium]